MVYGHYFKTIRKRKLGYGYTCPVCGATDSMSLETCCRVNHVMFIPIYPDRKQVLAGCCICEQKFSLKAFPGIGESDLRFMQSIGSHGIILLD